MEIIKIDIRSLIKLRMSVLSAVWIKTQRFILSLLYLNRNELRYHREEFVGTPGSPNTTYLGSYPPLIGEIAQSGCRCF